MRPRLLPTLTALILLAGICLLQYPDASNWSYQRQQARITSSYAEIVKHVHPDKSEQLAAAHTYNASLDAKADLKANTRLPQGTGIFTEDRRRSLDSERQWTYENILSADRTGLMARVRIPSIRVDLPVYHGTSDEVLLKGIGHLEGTSLPVGGKGTRTVLTAHRGLAKAEMFTNLDKLKVGDTFSIEVFDEILTYKVFDIAVIEPENTRSLHATAGADQATLVTCTPLGINSHRILVTGQRIPAQRLSTAPAP